MNMPRRALLAALPAFCVSSAWADEATRGTRPRPPPWRATCGASCWALLRAGLPKGWRMADKTGNNGADALGDIAVAWPAPGRPVVICAYTQRSRKCCRPFWRAWGEWLGRNWHDA